MDKPRQLKTCLPSYDLWYDGSIVINPRDIEQFINKVPCGKLFTQSVTDDIKQFNSLMPAADRIGTKAECNELDFSWNVPEAYKLLNVKQFVMEKLQLESNTHSDELIMIRIERVLFELKKYHEHNLINLLQCLIYVVDKFVENDLVWGVGRGSSVSSYVLYLIGIHDIDSVLYDLPFSDFIKT